jgi:hypothetical protein
MSICPSGGLFSAILPQFLLKYIQYSCKKLCLSGEKFLIVVHISIFQTAPKKTCPPEEKYGIVEENQKR